MSVWQIRGRVLPIGTRALVMGIVNVTPDSFSDGGKYFSADAAVAHGLELEAQGADILDIGGESTRPGAVPLPLDEELRRVLPVVEALAGKTNIPLSIDTYKPAVARACLTAGAHVVNDVTGLSDPAMTAVVCEFGAGAILMHMQGTPATMQIAPHYDDVFGDIVSYFDKRIAEVTALGVERAQLVIDPGLGFGKTFQHNVTLLARLGEFRKLGLPICLGASRKGFIGKITRGDGWPVTGGGQIPSPATRYPPPATPLSGSLAVAAFALAQDAAQIVRVHDVAPTRDLVLVWEKLIECGHHAPRDESSRGA